MSDAEKRTARGRAATIAICAVAVAFGGQIIGQRFDVQKRDEAFRADAAELNQSLAAREEAAPANTAGVKLVSFTNTITAETLGLRTSREPNRVRAPALQYADFNNDPERSRDARTLATLAAWSTKNFNLAEVEQRELDCLAEAVYYEARSESMRGQMAVAEVVMNRVRDSRFPKTVCAVVYQGHYRETGCQFTFTCDGSLNNKPRGEAWDRARVIALHVSLGLSKPVTNSATHYHTDYVNPYWSAGLVETAVVGTHIFYRFPKGGAEWARARTALDAQQAAKAALVSIEPDAAPQPVAEAVPVSAPLLTISTARKPEEAKVTAAAAEASAL